MRLNNKGFAWLPVLLAVLAVLAVSGGAWWYVQQKAVPAVEQSQESSQASPSKTAVAQPTEWRLANMLPASDQANSGGWTWYWLAGGVINCMSRSMPEADLQTFEAASTGEYARDKNHVYRCNDILAEADPKTFVVLGSGYGKDAKHVYVNGVAVTGADAATFELVGQSKYQLEYSKDKNRAYSLGREVLNADPRTFSATDNEWYTDKNSQFINGKRVRGVTASTFLKSVVTSLPTQCQKGDFAQSNYPLPFRAASMFSTDGSVRGYGGSDVCIVDSKANTVEYYHLPGEAPVLSRDGSKIYYTKYYGKEWGMGESSQAEIDAFYAMYNAGDYGLHVLDRKSGADVLLVHSVLPLTPSSTVAIFWTGGMGSGEIVDVDVQAGLLLQMPTDAKQGLLIVRKLPQTQWDFLTAAEVEQLAQVRTVQLPAGEEFRRVAEVSPDGKYVDYLHVKSGTVLPAHHGRLNIATGENVLSTY